MIITNFVTLLQQNGDIYYTHSKEISWAVYWLSYSLFMLTWRLTLLPVSNELIMS